jgi:hypothetical protein
VSDAVPRAHGSIIVRCTDTGEEYALEGVGGTPRVNQAPGEGPHQVEIRGPTNMLRAVIEGRQEASRALAAGGITLILKPLSKEVARVSSLPSPGMPGSNRMHGRLRIIRMTSKPLIVA